MEDASSPLKPEQASSLAPDSGVNKAFLLEAIDSILRKRGYSANTDHCFRYLVQLHQNCDDNNSIYTKRGCVTECSKFYRWFMVLTETCAYKITLSAKCEIQNDKDYININNGNNNNMNINNINIKNNNNIKA